RPNTRYQTLEEFRARPVLPNPRAFGELTGDETPVPSRARETLPQGQPTRGVDPRQVAEQASRGAVTVGDIIEGRERLSGQGIPANQNVRPAGESKRVEWVTRVTPEKNG